MKSLLIGDHRETLLDTLEMICKHWGYRVTVTSRPARPQGFLRATTPDMLIMGAGLLAAEEELRLETATRVKTSGTPLVVLREETAALQLEVDYQPLDVPLDVFALFTLIQSHLEEHPRKNLRLPIKLPGMLCAGESSRLAEVLSLSARGMLLKTGARLREGEKLRMIFPLMGMKQELEVPGRVLYRIEPGAHNNYMEGVGIEFVEMDEDHRLALNTFIERCFLRDLTASRRGAKALTEDQLRILSPESTLRLLPNR